ncbi:MAG TPA: HD domain-containing protein [Gemmatimonadales bacterium]|jgi:HD superfamily phosphohydrolase YqeK|nr:HD domain-containing protein [Gemmatimonadales bacterium]
MPGLARRALRGARGALKALARLVAPRAPERAEALTDLPPWARCGSKRRAHVRRVAELVELWAEEVGVSKRERDRWLRAVWLHDALRDARLTKGTTHGPAAADRAALDGESDRGVLDAVRYHSLGYAAWDDVGKMLYLADYLEPGRKRRAKEREKLAERVPRDRDRVLREVVALQIRSRLRAGRPVHPLTLEFWNSLTDR